MNRIAEVKAKQISYGTWLFSKARLRSSGEVVRKKIENDVTKIIKRKVIAIANISAL